MEGEKRKKDDGDAASGSRKKARDDDQGTQTEVTEDQVEEFFAILRRIHVAFRYFQKVNGDCRKLTEIGSSSGLSLSHAIEGECSQNVNGVKSNNREKRQEGVEQRTFYKQKRRSTSAVLYTMSLSLEGGVKSQGSAVCQGHFS
ncbi:hypothetical protein F0562_034026 [Nyssa sinensis]|uniref:Uncharacterized protein n=1 Tax=Nyssa sinensis TaxID=561372 RepID=A0A5J5ADS9_9ASTE|nr:hypothetical protein F0562_034026 [Nyssa sinensis]